ncbi:patatin-like phospholipase family protein [Parvularcula marina]|uniref:Patatin-like phospholipase family protein n=1 Tax=Parvularcula marina TaxID=2292771 RepID=A0A371RF73_9PROT|nr:patatin-like phospholipase family protein [Parvularcula marina]RFB04111.1 patatin-like phospholipase family protein [Parvularcula marina]
MSAAKPINLALQGGGSHGAYAWGVADRLLESGRVKLNAITATSAGAMNAAVLAYGMHVGGEDGARAKLKEFWRAVARERERLGFFDNPLSDQFPIFGEMSRMFTHMTMEALHLAASPYQLNPLGLNPLKEILEHIIDFDELRKCNRIKLFITATNVRTGKAKVFRNEDITVDVLLASACLPNLYQAVEIGDEAYWDGGFMGNPSLWPLFYETDVEDLLVVHINPIERNDVPHTAAEISNRVNEISFNTALLKEMRAIAFVQKLIEQGWIKKQYEDQLSDIKFHSIRADAVFEAFDVASKYDTSWSFLEDLHKLGRIEADRWLDEHYRHVGKKSSVNLHEEFLGV